MGILWCKAYSNRFNSPLLASFHLFAVRFNPTRLPVPRLRTGLQLNQALRGDDWEIDSACYDSARRLSPLIGSLQPNTLGSSSVKNYLQLN